MRKITRRNLLKKLLLGLMAFLPSKWLWAKVLEGVQVGSNDSPTGSPSLPGYRGPKVILIRFGGGVRRKETLDPDSTYSPFFCHDLSRRGVLFKNMEIAQLKGINTSHGEG